MQELKFENAHYLHLLWALPVLAGVYWYGFERKARALRLFATDNLFSRLMPEVSTARQKVKAGLVVGSIACLVVAAADPRWGKDIVDLQRRGVDIMVCLDVSRSMLAEDIAPNRLERAKIELKDMLGILSGDRVGLVTFAGTPVVSCPLTINYGAFRMTLDEVDTRSSPRGGTLIGDAVRLAARSFSDKVKGHKAILLITDGEDQDSLPVEAARDAFEQQKIRVFTLGFGDATQGTRIPITLNGRKTYLQHDGQEVWSKMDLGVLQEMALVGGGMCFPPGTRDVDFADVYERIRSKVEAREFEATKKSLGRARYQWPAGLALLLLLTETLLTERKPAAQQQVLARRAAA